MNELSVVEVQRLEALESVIDAGMQTFVQVGNALLENGMVYWSIDVLKKMSDIKDIVV